MPIDQHERLKPELLVAQARELRTLIPEDVASDAQKASGLFKEEIRLEDATWYAQKRQEYARHVANANLLERASFPNMAERVSLVKSVGSALDDAALRLDLYAAVLHEELKAYVTPGSASPSSLKKARELLEREGPLFKEAQHADVAKSLELLVRRNATAVLNQSRRDESIERSFAAELDKAAAELQTYEEAYDALRTQTTKYKTVKRAEELQANVRGLVDKAKGVEGRIDQPYRAQEQRARNLVQEAETLEHNVALVRERASINMKESVLDIGKKATMTFVAGALLILGTYGVGTSLDAFRDARSQTGASAREAPEPRRDALDKFDNARATSSQAKSALAEPSVPASSSSSSSSSSAAPPSSAAASSSTVSPSSVVSSSLAASSSTASSSGDSARRAANAAPGLFTTTAYAATLPGTSAAAKLPTHESSRAETTIRQVLNNASDLSWILYIDREARNGTLYAVGEHGCTSVYKAPCTLAANPGNKARVNDYRTHEGVFKVETAAIGDFSALYGSAFLNLEDKPYAGLQVTGTRLEDRLSAIASGRDSTNGAATFRDADARRIVSAVINAGVDRGRVVIESPSRPLYATRERT